jgi:hypothetical protein
MIETHGENALEEIKTASKRFTKIQKLENDIREQSLAHMTERFRLIEEISAISERAKTEKIQMQQALVKCALGPEPAQAALRVLYEMPANREVFEINWF